MYRVVVRFVDLQDNNHVYRVGDVYPRQGMEVDAERLEELTTDRNRRGVVLIAKEGLSEATEDTGAIETGVDPSGASEATERPRRRQKKDA